MSNTPPKIAKKHWSFFQRARYLIIFKVIPWFIHHYFRFVIHDKELGNSYPEGTPVAFCSNHQSNLDALIVGGAVAAPYGTRRFISFMGAGYVMKENWLYRQLTWAGGFPVYYDKPSPALRFAAKTLKEGKAIYMSPQGKRIGKSPVDDYFNIPKEPRSGIGRVILLMNGKLPVVPMFIHGAGAALSRGGFLPRYKSYVSVSFGEPLSFEEYAKDGGWKENDQEFFPTAKKIATRIMAAINEQMLKQEEYFFKIVERKYKRPISQISEDLRKEKSFQRYLRNLCNYTPKELRQTLDKLNT
ncbi:MAG: lysophospholipid acyltransferase family protein [Candidatus Hodarchaeales archaeon]|jgi:1-acyl-sn-glycerol-3-phosphate acyltransferase